MNAPLHINRHNLHEVSVDGRRLLFHIPTSSLFELDAVGGEVIDQFRHDRVCSPEFLVRALGGNYRPVEITDTLDELQRLEILAGAGRRRREVPDYPLDHFPLTTIVLNVNTGCNLSCSYCYKEDLATPAAGEKMDLETARRSIELLLRESPDQDRYNIVFFGGEPLSNFPLIREVVEYAGDRFAAIGKPVDFSLTTNATLLTDAIIDYLDAYRFGISVSIDGPRACHDRNRRSAGGQGTYTAVAQKARRLLRRYRSRPIGARVTLTRGSTDVIGIWEHLYMDMGFDEVGFAPVTSGANAGYNLDPDEIARVFENMKDLGRRYCRAALDNRNIGFSNLHQLMGDLYQGTSKALPCGAGTGMIAIDGQGGINLCHRFTGSGLPLFGNVRDGLDRVPLSDFLRRRLDRSGTDCRHCHIRNLCSGGCYHESYTRYNDPHVPTYHYCELLRDWIDFGIEIYGRILAGNPAFFDTWITPRRPPP